MSIFPLTQFGAHYRDKPFKAMYICLATDVNEKKLKEPASVRIRCFNTLSDYKIHSYMINQPFFSICNRCGTLMLTSMNTYFAVFDCTRYDYSTLIVHCLSCDFPDIVLSSPN